MSIKRNNKLETKIDNLDHQDEEQDVSPSTKLERRRRIEDLFEERRLRAELSEFG